MDKVEILLINNWLKAKILEMQLILDLIPKVKTKKRRKHEHS